MKKYLTKVDIELLETHTRSLSQNMVKVTCMGLYNHGKSSLLNALINDFEDKMFKVADVRETAVNKSYEFENIIYVDTPGLNAKEHDDKRVMDAVKESDINLFVHTVTTGEFAKKEIDFLDKVKKHWKNPQEFIDRTIFVVSRVDKANDETDIINTVEKMAQQILEIFDSEAMIIPVSAIRYTKGKLEEKSLLVKKSNIERLKADIAKLSEEHAESIVETKRERLETYYDSLIAKFSAKIQGNKLEVSRKEYDLDEYQKSLKSDIARTEDRLSDKYTSLE